MSKPTKDEPQEVGIQSRGVAEQDERERARLTGQPLAPARAEDTLAVRALELANDQGESPADTVKRAQQYYQFLKENSDG